MSSRFESGIKQIPYSQRDVFAKLSDLNNLNGLKEKMADANIPADENIEKAKSMLKDIRFDSDSITIKADMVGDISMRIVEREEPKCIKLTSDQSPIDFKLWIQLLPVEENSSKMRLTLDADIPFFAKAMVTGPLKEGIEKIADVLAMVPYK